MDHAQMLALLECIRDEYDEHHENLSEFVANMAAAEWYKERYLALQATARDCADAVSQAITLLSQPEGVLVPKGDVRLLVRVIKATSYRDLVTYADMTEVEYNRVKELLAALSQKGES